jgi:two-component system response regulator RegA
MRHIETALLVDDDAAFRTTLQLALRRRGVQARTAATVDEGLIALEDAPADLVVLDNRMPHGDGMTSLERFRARAPLAVILMLTGFGEIPLAVQAVRSGADAFLTKPLEADRLLAEAEAIRAQPRRGDHLPAIASTLNLEAVEREAITAAMRQTGGVVAQAAKVLGIDRRTLQRKLRRMD